MARISDEEIERLTREVSIERMVLARGVELIEKGSQLTGTCPFHEGGDAPLIVDRVANTWQCWTCSPEPGSVITWTMKAEGISRRLAIELLREDSPGAGQIGVRRGRQQGPVPKHSTVQRLPLVTGKDVDDSVLLREVTHYYREVLKQRPEALTYLQDRGLRSGEIIEHFSLGFADRTLAYRLPPKGRKDGAELRARLQHLGILRESGHEHLNGSLVIPIVDAAGSVVQLYGRKITSNLRPGTELHTWLPGPRRGVWNLAALGASIEIVLCQSLIDALAFWCHGIRNVTAVHGLDGPTADLFEAVKATEIRRVLIAFRRDDAGDAAAERLGATLAEVGVETRRVLFPTGMDTNDFARSVPNPAEALAQAVRSSTWIAGKGNHGNKGAPATPAAEVIAVGLAANAPESDADVVMTFDDRRWRVRGLAKNSVPEALRVNLMVMRDEGAFHVDAVELYSARQRLAFTRFAAEELSVDEKIIKRDLGRVLLHLEQLQQEQLRAEKQRMAPPVTLSDAERDEALALLRDPHLLDRVVDDFGRIGVVGEQTNLLIGYLAATSRKLQRPLGVLIQSSSAAGKSSVMEAVLDFVPEEDRLSYSAMTGQSLFYLGESEVRHKVLSIAEEAGAERASYALKLLQSEGRLTIASTGKDPGTGRLVSLEYRVEGPVAIMMTTTAIDVDEELVNRCLVLTVDEGREQTRAIHKRQRRAQTVEGIINVTERERIIKRHRNAQRLLRSLVVVNPFIDEIEFADQAVRARRDHRKFLTLIESLTLLHQHQRPVKTVEHEARVIQYIEATKDDIRTATKLLNEIVGRNRDDLPPVTRRLHGLLYEFVTAEAHRLDVDRPDYRFTQRHLREQLAWGTTQLKVHLRRLVEAEYVVVHPARHGRGVVYELVFDPADVDEERSGHGRPSGGPVSGDGRGVGGSTIEDENRRSEDRDVDQPRNAHPGPCRTPRS